MAADSGGKYPLDNKTFAQIVRSAPLISLDIIVRDSDAAILVGMRTNEPAKGFYFVPGGVVRKGEPIQKAFARILATEIGRQAALDDARFLGVYQHFYATNVFGAAEYGTHYVVLAYELQLGCRPDVTLDSQHADCRWMTESELIAAPDVHDYTKAYFSERYRTTAVSCRSD